MKFRMSGRARLASAAIPLSLAIVATLLVGGAWSEPGAQPAPPPPRDPSTVSAVAPDVSCPPGSLGFANRGAHYSVCYPQGWGFTDFKSAAPVTAVLTRSMNNLHLVSANAFPWVAGTPLFDAIERGVTGIELDVVPLGTSSEGECEPLAMVANATLPSTWCEQAYDGFNLPATEGAMHAIKVAVPLAPTASGASSLMVIIRTNRARQGVEAAWQLVRSIRAL